MKYDMTALIALIRVEMSWNMGDPENDCKQVDDAKLDEMQRYYSTESQSVKKEETFEYHCYPGSPIITEMREVIAKFNPKLKLVTIYKELYGDYHEYMFAVRFRVGQEPDDEITDDANYEEALFKIDKFMSDDPEVADIAQEIISVEELTAHLTLHMVNEERFHDISESGTIRGLAEYMISERTAIPGTEGGHQMK